MARWISGEHWGPPKTEREETQRKSTRGERGLFCTRIVSCFSFFWILSLDLFGGMRWMTIWFGYVFVSMEMLSYWSENRCVFFVVWYWTSMLCFQKCCTLDKRTDVCSSVMRSSYISNIEWFGYCIYMNQISTVHVEGKLAISLVSPSKPSVVVSGSCRLQVVRRQTPTWMKPAMNIPRKKSRPLVNFRVGWPHFRSLPSTIWDEISWLLSICWWSDFTLG